MRRLVILGAGTAGTMVANKLRAKYTPAELDITIVDQDDQHHYQPGYLFLPFGQLAPGQIVRSRHSFIPDGVNMLLCGVQRVDAEAKQVHLRNGGILDYDTLLTRTTRASAPSDRAARFPVGVRCADTQYRAPRDTRLTSFETRC